MIHENLILFLGKIFSTTLLLPILKIKFSVAEIVKRIFFKLLYLNVKHSFTKLETVES